MLLQEVSHTRPFGGLGLKIQGGNDAKDSALQGLIDTGLVNQVMVGKTYSYTVTTLGTQLLAGQE